jgi:1-acyl-sn-glycerol-3-phosphate acyltransferase
VSPTPPTEPRATQPSSSADPAPLPPVRERYPNQGFVSRAFYKCCWLGALAVLKTCYGLRRLHLDRVPARGPLIIVANHQSHFDPPVVSMCLTRRATHFLARDSLFHFKPFAWLIRNLNSIPVKRGQTDTTAIKEGAKRIHDGAALLIFPEGTRSREGELGAFKRGVLLFLRKAQCPVLPVGLDGCQDAFPRHRTFPKLRGVRIAVAVGEPIAYDNLMAHGPDAALERLHDELQSLQQEARAAR